MVDDTVINICVSHVYKVTVRGESRPHLFYAEIHLKTTALENQLSLAELHSNTRKPQKRGRKAGEDAISSKRKGSAIRCSSQPALEEVKRSRSRVFL